MRAIFKKEFLGYFRNMTGYIFLSFFIFVTGLYFSMINILSGLLDYQYVLSAISMLFLIIIPLLTMNLFSQEKRNKTDQLLFTAPVSISKITLGKYFASLSLLLVGLLITFIFPAILLFFVENINDFAFGSILSSYLGYFLLGGCFIAVGLFISSLFENPIVVSIVTFGTLFLFYILEGLAEKLPKDKFSCALFVGFSILCLCWILYRRIENFLFAGIFFLVLIGILISLYFFMPDIFDSGIYKILIWFSLLSRFNNFSNGILSLADIFYYLSFIIFCLGININMIENKRN